MMNPLQAQIQRLSALRQLVVVIGCTQLLGATLTQPQT